VAGQPRLTLQISYARIAPNPQSKRSPSKTRSTRIGLWRAGPTSPCVLYYIALGVRLWMRAVDMMLSPFVLI
jgi:hypothetical protein